jgi:uncharacterized DUF497 family protein
MRIDFDPAKSERNRKDRGLPFERVVDFNFAEALLAVDERKDYGEVRYVALGLLDDRLHVLCFTETQEGIRVISLRKANAREVARYAKSKATD